MVTGVEAVETHPSSKMNTNTVTRIDVPANTALIEQ